MVNYILWEDPRQKRLGSLNGQPAAWILRGSSFFATKVRSTSEIHSINISQYTTNLARKYPIKCADNLLYSIYATLVTGVRRFGIFYLALGSNSIRYRVGRIPPQRVPFWQDSVFPIPLESHESSVGWNGIFGAFSFALEVRSGLYWFLCGSDFVLRTAGELRPRSHWCVVCQWCLSFGKERARLIIYQMGFCSGSRRHVTYIFHGRSSSISRELKTWNGVQSKSGANNSLFQVRQ